MKEGHLAIVIPGKEYLLRVESCKHNIHGRVVAKRHHVAHDVESESQTFSDMEVYW